MHTITKERSVLSALVQGGAPIRRDKVGRLFIDRDPTYFRWILNYLRDGYLVTLPPTVQERVELLNEARYFNLPTLAHILEANHVQNLAPEQLQHQILHQQQPLQLQALQQQQQQLQVQQLQAQQQQQQQQQQQHQQIQSQTQPPQPLAQSQSRDGPTFQTARPSAKGIFFIPDFKWNMIIPHQLYKDSWDVFGAKFEDGKDEVIFQSLSTDQRGTLQLIPTEIVTTAKLQAEKNAKAVLMVDGQHCGVEIHFWWEPSNSSLYPHLWTKIQRGDTVLVTCGLDFLRTEAE